MENREIKFRAFYTESGIMSDWNEIDALDKEGSCPFIDILKNPRFKIMQFTGLKDKNGKDIYESDILMLEPEKNWLIIWDSYKCGFFLQEQTPPKKFDGRIGKPQITAQKYLVEAMQIIGNSYENPDLLKQNT